jgi:hypothetical protein
LEKKMNCRFIILVALALAGTAPCAKALELSTSLSTPAPLPADGVIEGNYPASTGETAYYFAVDLKAGALASQIRVMGTDAPKRLWLALLDGGGNKISEYGLNSGYSDDGDIARNWPVDHSGRYILRVTAKGPELATYRIELGGSAFAGHTPSPAAGGYSQSFLDPTHLGGAPAISGAFPAVRTTTTYYFDADLKAGALSVQMSMAARKELGGTKWVMFEVLGPDGDKLAGAELERTFASSSEKTYSLSINHSGRYVMRLSIKGTEGATYKVALGGDALAVTN